MMNRSIYAPANIIWVIKSGTNVNGVRYDTSVFPYVLERSTNKVQSVGYDYIYKIEIQDTGLKTKQMADWAITTFNFETLLLPPDDILAYFVWIQPMRDVSIGRESYDEDGWPRDVAEHWV